MQTSSLSRSLLLLLLCLLAALAPVSCGKKAQKEPTPPKEPPPPPPDPVTQAVNTVVKACTVTRLGELRNCVGPAVNELKAAEEKKGVIASLKQHCELAREGAREVRIVAANRIGALSLHRALKRQPDPAVFRCLMQLLNRPARGELWPTMRVIRAATFLGTAMEEEQLKELLGYLEAKETPLPVKQVGYECLWANGRMRVFDRLQQAVRGDDPGLQRAVVTGFAYVNQLGQDEADKVCSLLGELMGDKGPELAGAAAAQLARLCVAQRAAILATTEKLVTRRSVPLGFVNALGYIGSSRNPAPTPAQRRRVVQLLTRIVRTPMRAKPCPACARRRGPDIARLAAQRQMERLEPIQAAKLEKRYKLKEKTKKAMEAATENVKKKAVGKKTL